MAKQRKICFGYQVKDGEIIVNHLEAKTVNDIYDLYIKGNSYLAISRILNDKSVRYSEKSIWNKNNVGRLLKCIKYLGDEKYSAIISAKKYDMAQDIVSGKCVDSNFDCEDEAIIIRNKLYCSNCNSKLNSKYSRWKCTKCEQPADIQQDVLYRSMTSILNRLIEDNELIDIPDAIPYSPDIEIKRLENELSRQLGSRDIVAEAISKSIFGLADVRYQKCDDGMNGINGRRIKEYLLTKEVSNKLNTDLLDNITDRIIVQPDGDFYILLINGQKIR
jgi:hypothetical protein